MICGDDVICSRMMSRLQAEGYRIPLDIGIASLYNGATLDCFTPAVTAVNISETAGHYNRKADDSLPKGRNL